MSKTKFDGYADSVKEKNINFLETLDFSFEFSQYSLGLIIFGIELNTSGNELMAYSMSDIGLTSTVKYSGTCVLN